MPYYFIKKGEKPEKGYPLFLYMHGSGPKDSEWENGFRLCSMFDDSPSLYFVPQIPIARGELYRWAIQSKQWAWEKLLRLAFVNGDIDPNRIYFFGISEGGYGSQRLASFYADYLAGAGPMAGGEPLKNAPMENVANIAFSLRTGANDDGFGRNILTQKALEVADSLEKAHPGFYKHFIDVIPGYGHAIDYTPTTSWLAKFSRNPHPEYFYFEMYDMYGRKRETFYNPKVNEPSSSSERSCYEVKRDGNTIELNATIVRYTTTYSLGGIEMYFKKKYRNSKKGNVTIYLNEEIVDFSQPVRVVLNGKEVFNGMVATSLKSMVESCALFYDPERLFTAAIDVDIPSGTAVATSVDAVKEVDDVDVPSGAVYDLTGRRVEESTRPGIYIKDGKAVLVR
jgi:predicted esterase